ncbi:16140_t:CDS:1, partial [Dentiscutata heterogama]
ADDRYSPEDIHASLEELAVNEELTFEEIPSVKTIKGWIGRYSANFKKVASEKALSENNSNILAFERNQ